jgi:amino-acid N-acetyltransferase
MQIRRSNFNDISTISSLLSENTHEVSLFQQTDKEIGRNINDFLIAEDKDQAIGCVALHRYNNGKIAEILGISVLCRYQNSGIGKELIYECIRIAVKEKTEFLWLATAKPIYFEKLGFETISKWSLPRKVLKRKLSLVFQQSVDRWLPALFGRHTFMRYYGAESDQSNNIS